MASPAVAAAIENSTNTAGTSHTLSGLTWTANQLMLIILDKGSTSATISQSSGPTMTELLDEASANGLYVAYRYIQSGDSGNIILTSSASTRTASITYRISGASRTKAPEIGTTGSGTSTTPDPPTSATPAVSRDCLVIAFYGAAGEEADDDTWSDTPPTGYTPSPPRQKACGVAGTNLGGLIASAEKAITGMTATDNPGTFAKDVSAAWRSQTVLVYPHLEINAASASYTLTGAAMSPIKDSMVNAASGSYTVTGANAGLALAFFMNAEPGAYNLTGVAAELIKASMINAASGTYAVSGFDAGIVAGRVINAEPGSYTIDGYVADLVYTQGGTDYPLDCQPASFALTGFAAGTIKDSLINAEPGAYTLAGIAAGLIADRVLDSQPGAFVLTGTAASVVASRVLEATAGSFAINGAAASLIVDRVIQASPGVYVVTGVAATFDYSGAAPVTVRMRTMTGVGL